MVSAKTLPTSHFRFFLRLAGLVPVSLPTPQHGLSVSLWYLMTVSDVGLVVCVCRGRENRGRETVVSIHVSTSGCFVSPNWPTFLLSRGGRALISLCSLLTDEPQLKQCLRHGDRNNALSQFTRSHTHTHTRSQYLWRLDTYGRSLSSPSSLRTKLQRKEGKNIIIRTVWNRYLWNITTVIYVFK